MSLRRSLEVYEQAIAVGQPSDADGRSPCATSRAGRPGAREPARRLPSLEPASRRHAAARCGCSPARVLLLTSLAGIALATSRFQKIGVTPVAASLVASFTRPGRRRRGSDVRVDVRARHRLARDPQGRAHAAPRSPARRATGHLHRRPDERHASRPPRRAFARADRRTPYRPCPRDVAGGAGHDGLPDAAQPARARDPRRGDVLQRQLRRQAHKRAAGRRSGSAGRSDRLLLAPVLVPRAAVSRSRRLGRLLTNVRAALLRVRAGLRIFRNPRQASLATAIQLSAWGLQWFSCWLLLRALGLPAQVGFGAAAAVLFAVNVTAVIPATPANVGVFQAACVAVLAGAYHVPSADALAYGIVLQAVEVATAVIMGAPALVGEGLSWRTCAYACMHATPVKLGPLPGSGSTRQAPTRVRS